MSREIPDGWTSLKTAGVIRLTETELVQFLYPDGTASEAVELPAGSEIEHDRGAVRRFTAK